MRLADGAFFTNSDRERFYNAIRVMREAWIDVRRTAPINGLDYETAGTLMHAIDDAVGALTGDGEALWRKPHGCSVPIPDAVLKPVDPLDGGVRDASHGLSRQLGDFVVEQGPVCELVLKAWDLLGSNAGIT